MRGHVHRRERKLKSGKTSVLYYVVVDVGRHPDGRRKQQWHGGYTTRKEAEAIRAAIVNDLNRGHYILPSSVTVAEFVHDQWLKRLDVELKPTSRDGYRGVMLRHILPTLGHLKLQAIRTIHINDLLIELHKSGRADSKGGLAVSTVKTVRTVISHCLGHAYDCGLVARNVAERAKVPRQPFQAIERTNVWDAAQLRRFLHEVTGHRLEAMWRLAALTGLRRGELLALRWADIELANRKLWVRRALVLTRDGAVETTPKNGRERVVDLDKETTRLMVEYARSQHAEKIEWGELYVDDDFVFAQEHGLPINPSAVSEAFSEIAKKAGLPHIRLHDLRHSHASQMVHAGVALTTVAARLGHSSAWFTWRQYGHLLGEEQAEAAELVARAVTPA